MLSSAPEADSMAGIPMGGPRGAGKGCGRQELVCGGAVSSKSMMRRSVRPSQATRQNLGAGPASKVPPDVHMARPASRRGRMLATEDRALPPPLPPLPPATARVSWFGLRSRFLLAASAHCNAAALFAAAVRLIASTCAGSPRHASPQIQCCGRSLTAPPSASATDRTL